MVTRRRRKKKICVLYRKCSVARSYNVKNKQSVLFIRCEYQSAAKIDNKYERGVEGRKKIYIRNI